MFTMFVKRKQAKVQQLQEPTQSNGDTLNNASVKLLDTSGKKRKEHLRAKIVELETDSKTKNIIDLCGGNNDFKKVTSLELMQ